MIKSRIVLTVVVGGVAVAVPAVSRSASADGPCTDGSRACVISAATTYLDALVSHDVSHVRLAPDAIRTENGVDTGDGAPDIESQLATGPQYAVITRLRDVSWIVDGDQGVVTYLIDTGPSKDHTLNLATAHVMERFRVDGGLIREIEASFCFAPGTVPDRTRATSLLPVETSLCVRSGPSTG